MGEGVVAAMTTPGPGRIELRLMFLAGCLLLSEIVAKIGGGTTMGILGESLTVGGWVAMWRSLEIFLYDWWPLRDERKILERLGRMQVRLVLPVNQQS